MISKILKKLFKTSGISRRVLYDFIFKLLKFFINPAKWLNALKRSLENANKLKLWQKFDKSIRENAYIKSYKNAETILVDGLWDNPNHFMRLRIFLEALKDKNLRLVAFVNSPESRSINTLKAMGFNEFFYISDFPIIKRDINLAIETLKNIKTHKDLLKIELPENLPAYYLYDTVLKTDRYPQTPLSSKLWLEKLSDIYRLDRFYNDIFASLNINKIILSHVVKNEFGLLLFKGIRRKITCFNIYAAYEMMRIKKFNCLEDLERPMEILSFNDFHNLDENIQKNINKAGLSYTSGLAVSKNTDINITRAYGMQKKEINLYESLQIPKDKFIVSIFFHSWFDFPHAYGMRNFTDFLDWTNTTLAIARKRKDIVWLLKPHPCETWYGGFYLHQVANKLPKHIHILDESISVNTALDVSRYIVTVHGTVAMESVARGIPAICADKIWFEDWDFVENAKSKKDYEKKLFNLNKDDISLNKEKIQKAAACAYLTLSPAEDQTRIKRLKSDHLPPSTIFSHLQNILKSNDNYLIDQSNLISEWLESDNKNFCIYHKINLHKNFANYKSS